jgi:CRISPR type III-B/RAMP module RAMP protein Cmr1
MNRAIFNFDVLTPAIAGGADPKQRAEIRPASIRGQLRWWFRVLGGFKSQSGALRNRENEVFGSISDGNLRASPLVIRVAAPPVSSPPQTMEDLRAAQFPEKGYLLWPLRRQEDARATLPAGSKFELRVLWKGPSNQWADVLALISVFSHLGSLGFRGRRAMGALAATSVIPLAQALSHFATPSTISVKALGATGSDHAIKELGGWLKSWRAYGRTRDNPRPEQRMPGFNWAKSDHDLGAAILSGNQPRTPAMYRAALGLPLNQRFQGGGLDWKPSGSGRFASPVLLRPHRTPTGQWKALVIFIHNHEWPRDNQASAGRGRNVAVSLDLLKAMQADPRLSNFS